MVPLSNPDTPAKCCAYCGGRDHDFEECPKRKADAGTETEAAPQDPTEAPPRTSSN